MGNPFQAPSVIRLEEKVVKDCFASIASSMCWFKSTDFSATSFFSSGVTSLLDWFWCWLSALFSWLAGRTKKYALEQAFKTFTQQMNVQNNAFNNAAFHLVPSPFLCPPATAPTSDSATNSNLVVSQLATVDVPATKMEDPSSISVNDNVPRRNETDMLL